MPIPRLPLLAGLLGSIGSVGGVAQASELRLVPTIENCSVYVEGLPAPAPMAATLVVQYRQQGSTVWLAAHPLVISANDPVPRGSLFGLRAGTAYEVRCLDAAGTTLAQAMATTWSDEVPVARTIELSASGPLELKESGTADGWLRYTLASGAVIDGGDTAEAAVILRGVHHVLLDGLTIRGGQRDGILLDKAQDVRVRGCDIAGWSRIGTQDLAKDGKFYQPDGKVINYDAGIDLGNSSRLVIERNWFHDPRGRANSWYYSHPAGPTSLFIHTQGQVVVRWNDSVGSDTHRWNDAIEGYGNGKDDGGFNCDSDIYGNLLAYGNDDGIELDGPQRNVRFYGNLVTGTLCGISTAPNLRGPSWVFANVVRELGDERGVAGAAVKNGGGSTWSRGLTWFYHNTFLTTGSGIAEVGFGEDKDRGRFNATTRNNLLAVTGDGIVDVHGPESNDYDHDLFALPWERAGTRQIVRPAEAHGVAAAAGFTAARDGDLTPAAGSAAYTTATALPGFAWLEGDHPVCGALSAGSRALPWRPHGLRATPSIVAFSGAQAAAIAAQRSVTIDTSALRTAQPFRVVHNQACDWLTVTPQDGTLTPGQPLTLIIALTAGISAHGGSGHGAVLLRLADGTSLPVLVTAEVAGNQFSVASEAEDLPGAEAFTVASDVDASHGRYLEFTAEESRKPGSKFLRLPLTIAVDGAYALALRVRCQQPIANHDSVFISIDGGAWENCPLSGGSDWQWISRTGPTGCRLALTAGAHEVRIAPRESLHLDAVVVRGAPLALAEAGLTLDHLTP